VQTRSANLHNSLVPPHNAPQSMPPQVNATPPPQPAHSPQPPFHLPRPLAFPVSNAAAEMQSSQEICDGRRLTDTLNAGTGRLSRISNLFKSTRSRGGGAVRGVAMSNGSRMNDSIRHQIFTADV